MPPRFSRWILASLIALLPLGAAAAPITFGPTSFPVDDGTRALDFQHTFRLNVPEPATWMMMVVGLLGLGFLGRRRGQW